MVTSRLLAPVVPPEVGLGAQPTQVYADLGDPVQPPIFEEGPAASDGPGRVDGVDRHDTADGAVAEHDKHPASDQEGAPVEDRKTRDAHAVGGATLGSEIEPVEALVVASDADNVDAAATTANGNQDDGAPEVRIDVLQGEEEGPPEPAASHDGDGAGQGPPDGLRTPDKPEDDGGEPEEGDVLRDLEPVEDLSEVDIDLSEHPDDWLRFGQVGAVLEVTAKLNGEMADTESDDDELELVVDSDPRPIGMELSNAQGEITVTDDRFTHEFRFTTTGTAEDGEHTDVARLYYFTEGDPMTTPSHLFSSHEHTVHDPDLPSQSLDAPPVDPRQLLHDLERSVGIGDGSAEVVVGEDDYLVRFATFNAIGGVQTMVWRSYGLLSPNYIPSLTTPLTVREGNTVRRLAYAESDTHHVSGYMYKEIDLEAGTQRSMALIQRGLNSFMARKVGNWDKASDDMDSRDPEYRGQLMDDAYTVISSGFMGLLQKEAAYWDGWLFW